MGTGTSLFLVLAGPNRAGSSIVTIVFLRDASSTLTRMDGTGIIWDLELVSRYYGVIFIPHLRVMRFIVSVPIYDDDSDFARLPQLSARLETGLLFSFAALPLCLHRNNHLTPVPPVIGFNFAFPHNPSHACYVCFKATSFLFNISY